ncbi:MAG: carboxylesterase family protein, partial [Pseudomonadota bacterium]
RGSECWSAPACLCAPRRPALSLKDGYLELTNYDRCLSAKELKNDAKLYTVDCTKAHTWSFDSLGRLSPTSNGSLCLTIDREQSGAVYSVPALVPAFKARKLSLQLCAETSYNWQTWRWSSLDELPSKNLNSLVADTPEKIAKSIRSLGDSATEEQIAELYQSEQRMFALEDITVNRVTTSTGDKELVLNIYQHPQHRTPSGSPILVIVADTASEDSLKSSQIATHFAGLGFIVVIKENSGIDQLTSVATNLEIAATIAWVSNNIADYDGSPKWINLLGYGSGANNVASYTLQPSLNGESYIPVSTVVIASPKQTEALADEQTAMADAIENASVPTLITLGEYQSTTTVLNALALYTSILSKNESRARIRQIPGHTDLSYLHSVGTNDHLFVEEVLDFIIRTARFQVGDH